MRIEAMSSVFAAFSSKDFPDPGGIALKVANQLAAVFGIVPDKIKYANRPNGRGRIVEYSKSNLMKLSQRLDELSEFDFIKMQPEGFNELTHTQWTVTFCRLSCGIGFCFCTLVPLPPTMSADTILQTVTLENNCTYGFHYLTEGWRIPSMNAFGFVASDNQPPNFTPDEQRSAEWLLGLNESCFDYGYLRDVFTLNYLSQPVVSRQIRGTTLSEWIGRSHRHGVLTQLTNERFLWKIKEEDRDFVRQEVSELVYDRKTFQRS